MLLLLLYALCELRVLGRGCGCCSWQLRRAEQPLLLLLLLRGSGASLLRLRRLRRGLDLPFGPIAG